MAIKYTVGCKMKELSSIKAWDYSDKTMYKGTSTHQDMIDLSRCHTNLHQQKQESSVIKQIFLGPRVLQAELLGKTILFFFFSI